MATLTLFKATKNAVVIESPDGEVIIIRDGLTPKQAKTMAKRLTGNAQDESYAFKPTRREQKFTIHAELDFELTSSEDASEWGGYYTANDLIQQTKEELRGTEPFEGVYEDPKVKVTVTKVYDKQVPNE